jgi:hypothetical protein
VHTGDLSSAFDGDGNVLLGDDAFDAILVGQNSNSFHFNPTNTYIYRQTPTSTTAVVAFAISSEVDQKNCSMLGTSGFTSLYQVPTSAASMNEALFEDSIANLSNRRWTVSLVAN